MHICAGLWKKRSNEVNIQPWEITDRGRECERPQVSRGLASRYRAMTLAWRRRAPGARGSGGGDGLFESMDGALVLFAEGVGEAATELGKEFTGVGEVQFPVVGIDAEELTLGFW